MAAPTSPADELSNETVEPAKELAETEATLRNSSPESATPLEDAPSAQRADRTAASVGPAESLQRPTTDTAAALRAMEIRADVILKATKVDGIYNADPMLHPDATRYDRISYLQVLEQRLKVMDATAISLCMDNKLPIVVFNLLTPGNIKRAVSGEPIGSLVGA